MRFRRPAAVFAAAAITLTACGGGGAEDPSTSQSEGATDAGEVGGDVAASVNGTEISRELLDGRIETASATPEVAQLLEGEQGEALKAQLTASVLSQLILNRIVLDGAGEMGLEVDEDAVAETRQQLVDESGSDAAFEEQVASAGLDPDQLTAELEAITAMRLVRDELGGAAASETPTEAASPGAEPGSAELQQWLVEQLEAAEVAVDPELGTWDAAQGRVVPVGGDVAPPAPAPAPDGSEAPAPGTGTTEAPATEPTATEPAPTGSATE